MRQFLLSVFCAVGFLSANAAGTTVTLQQGDSIKAFYGENAFISAYTAAADSAVITLSGGNFAFPDSIAKSITIIGNGAFSSSTLSPNTNITNTKVIYITADNVTLEGVKYNTNSRLALKNIKDCRIKRCNLFGLSDVNSWINQNTIIEDSYIIYFDAMWGAENLYINNCAINRFDDINSKDKLATIENTNVRYIVDNSTSYQLPYAIYRNCNLGYYYGYYAGNIKINLESPREFYNVTIQISKYSSYTYSINYGSGLKYQNVSKSDGNSNPYFSDGNWPSFMKWNGCGPVDHKSYPSIPRITESKVDAKTDGEGKLNIKLKVAVQD